MKTISPVLVARPTSRRNQTHQERFENLQDRLTKRGREEVRNRLDDVPIAERPDRRRVWLEVRNRTARMGYGRIDQLGITTGHHLIHVGERVASFAEVAALTDLGDRVEQWMLHDLPFEFQV